MVKSHLKNVSLPEFVGCICIDFVILHQYSYSYIMSYHVGDGKGLQTYTNLQTVSDCIPLVWNVLSGSYYLLLCI